MINRTLHQTHEINLEVLDFAHDDNKSLSQMFKTNNTK